MGLLGKIIVRIAFSVSIVIIIASGIVSINATLYDFFNAVMAVFAILSADILIEKYLSKEKGKGT